MTTIQAQPSNRTSHLRRVSKFPTSGFTLTELAVVMAIIALLIGGLMMPLSAQRGFSLVELAVNSTISSSGCRQTSSTTA